MARYYFDIRKGDHVALDEEGVEMPDLKSAQIEAADALLTMAKDCDPNQDCYRLAIEVRTDNGPLFQAAFVFEVNRSLQ